MTTHRAYPSLEQEELMFLTVAWAVAFAVLFNVCWWLLNTVSSTFRGFSHTAKADNTSRVISTLHALFVCPALTYGLFSCTYDNTWEPVTTANNGTQIIQFCFCISVAYFMNDFIMMVVHKTPSWHFFALHHILASTPFAMYLFNTDTERCVFLLALATHVEYPLFILNSQMFIEEWGAAKAGGFGQRIHKWCSVILVPMWFLFRVVNPTFLMYIIHFDVLPEVKKGRNVFFVSVLCAWAITLGCIAHWFLVVIPAARKALRQDNSSCVTTVDKTMTGKKHKKQWFPRGNWINS